MLSLWAELQLDFKALCLGFVTVRVLMDNFLLYLTCFVSERALMLDVTNECSLNALITLTKEDIIWLWRQR